MNAQRMRTAWIGLVGFIVVIVGLVLPMFSIYNPHLPEQAHFANEWQIITDMFIGIPLLEIVLIFAAGIPIIASLIVLVLSILVLRQKRSQKTVSTIGIVSLIGLVIQILLDLFVYVINGIAYAHYDISYGFVIVPIGLFIMILSVFFK